MSAKEEFSERVSRNITGIGKDSDFKGLTNVWLREAIRHEYAQNFEWLGRPIIQIPQDVYAVQELIWKIKPDLVIETGVAHGGSLILSASLLAMIDYCDAVENGTSLNPKESNRKVLGIDIDIRAHNRSAIEAHPMSHKIEMIEGSSIDEKVIKQVQDIACQHQTVMLFLDSNHTHDHVLAELEAYAPLVSKGSYCVVWDSGVENLPVGFVTDRPWGKGNNPKTAVIAYLDKLKSGCIKASDGEILNFEIDKRIENKIVLSASSDGFLCRC